jgi:hypothetical protein
MTAISTVTGRDTKRAGNSPVLLKQRVELGTDIVYAGGMVGRLSTGLCTAATATAGLRVIGVAMETVDNSAGDSGVFCDIERGAFWLANSADGDAILDDHIGEVCYAADDATVSCLPGTAGIYPIAGRVMAVSSTYGVLVEILGTDDKAAIVGTLPAHASNDVILAVANAKSGSVYDIATTAAATTVTLPAAAQEGAKLFFFADGTKNGHTVTYRDATGPVNLTTALTASKRHTAVAVFVGGKWGVNAYVSP